MRISAALMLVCGLVASACGGSSTGPSDTLNLAGAWTGTWTFVSAGATVSDSVTLTVTQTGNSASGQWSAAASGVTGAVTFTPTADFTGTATISQTLIVGGTCSATTTLTGTASANQIRFAFGTLTPMGLCQWATNQQFTFAR